ncbi:hypothetical protein ACFYNL_11545 [Streptomyces sp. NPDC007808]|uniref:hypothetical protein n=1 Tax=Streptomyces sp. NPDC007808 TaxID=3364779 RepID=UPI00368F7959
MATATLLCDVGPCDDDAYLFINGRLVVSTRLGETRQFRRDLVDGDYNFRFKVVNSGGWAWRAKLGILINGEAVAAVDEVGGSGFYTGQVYEQEWQVLIVDGKQKF